MGRATYGGGHEEGGRRGSQYIHVSVWEKTIFNSNSTHLDSTRLTRTRLLDILQIPGISARETIFYITVKRSVLLQNMLLVCIYK